MKTSIISPVGLSPPVVTELVEYVAKEENKFVSDVVLLVTDNRKVKESAELVVSALKVHYKNIHIHRIDLPFSDISSIDDHIKFMKISLRTIKEERIKHGSECIYLNIAGGRKDMSASLSILGQWVGVDGIFHIVSSEVVVFNELLERLRHEIKEHYEAEDLIGFYRKYQREFDKLMFPPRDSYRVIKIPYLPFPRTQLQEMVEFLIKDTPTPIWEVDMEREFLKGLERAGLVHITKKKVYPTEFGLKFAEIFG